MRRRAREGNTRMSDQTYFDERRRRFPGNAKGFLFAPIVWFVWFVSLYAVQGAGCELGLHQSSFTGTSVLRVVLGALTVLAATAIAAVGASAFSAWRNVRDSGDDAGGRPIDQSQFLAYGALLHAGLFIVAVIWTGIPIVMAGELCGP